MATSHRTDRANMIVDTAAGLRATVPAEPRFVEYLELVRHILLRDRGRIDDDLEQLIINTRRVIALESLANIGQPVATDTSTHSSSDVMNVTEAHRATGIPRRTLTRLADGGQLPGVRKTPGGWLLPRDTVATLSRKDQP